MRKTRRLRSIVLASCLPLLLVSVAVGQRDMSKFPFFLKHCSACHSGDGHEGGLDLGALKTDLADPATFATWERIYDRIASGEMPPKDADQPRESERQDFLRATRPRLHRAHAAVKGTVLRRLNRNEYQNTVNDMFGVQLHLAGLLPEDGRAHEFDNVGEALGLSMVHLQRYLDASNRVLEASIAHSTQRPEAQTIRGSYLGTAEAERFIGKVWKQLSDDAVARFAGGGYPSGMMRSASVRQSGRYRVTVTGYAFQSTEPIAFSVGGVSFARGSEKPIYGFWAFAPGEPGEETSKQSISFETRIENRYMISIEPVGISDPDRYKRKSIDDYKGPGLAILEVKLEGPLLEQWPSAGHRLIFDGVNRRPTGKQDWVKRDGRRRREPVFEIQSDNEEADALQSLRRVASRAYRRNADDAEIQPYIALFRKERESGQSFENALLTSVKAILCSPKFLFLNEPPGPLNDDALAARLAYFLTRTAPDPPLLSAAKAGRLKSNEELRRQAERLMNDERFDAFLTDFTDSWLDLREMDFTMPDKSLYPEFDSFLRYSMPLETRAYLGELFQSNLSVTHLVKSDFGMLNSRLAAHYGMSGIAKNNPQIQKVSLPADSLRGGFLSQASILKVTANGTNTSPVKRGAWVMERLLGTTPPPPPPGIPGVEPDIRGASTLRELLAKHRDSQTCNACHQKIDPPGFALETFNPIGGERNRYRSLGEGERVKKQVNGRRVNYRLGPDVDASGEFAGTAFRNYREFRDRLAADPDRLAQTMAEKLATFGAGRELGFSDREEIRRIVSESRRNGYGVRDLMHLVIQSRLFREK